VKLLYDKLNSLAAAQAESSEEWRFPRPSFKVVILYVVGGVGRVRKGC
jgi:hypothetical protein